MNTQSKLLLLALLLVPGIAHADAWTAFSVGGGQKFVSSATQAGLSYGAGIDLISQAGLGVNLGYQYSALTSTSGTTGLPLSQGTLVLNYYLTPGRPITPYIGYGLNFASFNGNTAQGTRAVAGLVMKMQGDLALKVEGAYDQLDNVGGSNLTGWTGTGSLVFMLSGPKDDGRPDGDIDRPGRPNMPPPGGPRPNGPRPGDRDRDGVPNRFDDAPNNPYRR